MMKRCLSLTLVFLLMLFCACERKVERSIPTCELQIEYQDGKIWGSVLYENLNDYLLDNTILFNLYPNKLFQKSCAITPLSVLLNKKELPFKLLGEFNEYMQVSADFKRGDLLEIVFEATFNEQGQRLGVYDGFVNLAYFYPHICQIEGGEFAMYPFTHIGDPFFDVAVDYNVQLTLPSTMAVACGLNAISVDICGENTCYYYDEINAKTISFCLSEKYMVASKKWGNKRVNYYYCNDKEPEKRLEKIISYLDFFSKMIGNYPYEVFTIAQTNYHVGGMEYPAFCVVNMQLSGAEFDYCILHEVAHQWFGIGVDFNQYKNAWLDEGLAECISMLYLKENFPKEYNQRLFYINGMCSAFEKAVSKGGFGYKEGVWRNLGEYNNEYEYVVCNYKKPAKSLLSACESIGERKFFGGLKGLFERYNGKIVELEEFLSCFKINGQKVQNCLPKGA